MPFDGIHFKTLDLIGFPGDHLPSIGKRAEMFGAKCFGAVVAPFDQDRPLAAATLWEDYPHSQSFGTMTNLTLERFLSFGKTFFAVRSM